MTASRRLIPNYTTMLAAAYKAAIDACFNADTRLAGWFAPHQVYTGSPNPDLAVEVDAGFVFAGNTLTEKALQTVTGFTIPSSGQHRIDRVVVDAITGVASRVAGTPATGSPSAVAPAIPVGKLPICQVLITSADTVITDSMITDERARSTLPGGTLLGTQQSASGATIDFPIPSGVKGVDILLAGVSLSGTNHILTQLQGSGAVETSGYSSESAGIAAGATVLVQSANGFISYSANASNVIKGIIKLRLKNGTTDWVSAHNLSDGTAPFIMSGSGSKSITGELTNVRLAASGADSYDAGTINLQCRY